MLCAATREVEIERHGTAFKVPFSMWSPLSA